MTSLGVTVTPFCIGVCMCFSPHTYNLFMTPTYNVVDSVCIN